MLRLGTKYYRFLDDDSLEIIRCKKLIDKEYFLYLFEDENGKEIMLQDDQIASDYTKLNEDGILTFAIVELGGQEDVVVALHRTSDLKNDRIGALPYAVCRQNYTDYFANQVLKDDRTIYVGISVNQDNCIEDIPFNTYLACDEIHENESVAVYIDDKIDDILECLETEPFDKVLKDLYIKMQDAKTAFYDIKGYSDSLKSLLVNNCFDYDFLTGFNIIPIYFKLSESIVDNILNPEAHNYFENVLKCYMTNVVVVKYTKDININKIEKDYILVSDLDRDLYLITYEKGSYVNRPFSMLDDKRDYMLMTKYRKNYTK